MRRWHPSNGAVPASHPGRMGRSIVHLPTQTVVGWVVESTALGKRALLDEMLQSLGGSAEDISIGPRPLIIVQWCGAVHEALLSSEVAGTFNRLGIVTELPTDKSSLAFQLAVDRVRAAGVRCGAVYDGDTEALVSLHESNLLTTLRLPQVLSESNDIVSLRSRVAMRLMKVFAELEVIVVLDGVGSIAASEDLRRAGVRFALGTVYESLGATPLVAGLAALHSATVDLPREAERLEMVRRSGTLERNGEPSFDAVVGIVADRCRTPIAAVSIVDHDRQWFRASVGMSHRRTDRIHSFCSATMRSSVPLQILDTLADSSYSSNPLVTGAPHIRSYLGVALRASNGLSFGAICAIDTQPRLFEPAAVRELEALGQLITDSLQLRVYEDS